MEISNKILAIIKQALNAECVCTFQPHDDDYTILHRLDCKREASSNCIEEASRILIRMNSGMSKCSYIQTIDKTLFISSFDNKKIDSSLCGLIATFPGRKSISKVKRELVMDLLDMFLEIDSNQRVNTFNSEVLKITDSILRIRKLEITLKKILEQVVAIFSSDYAHIIEYEKEHNRLFVRRTTDSEIATGTQVPIDKSFAGWVVKNQKDLLAPELSGDLKKYKIFSSDGTEAFVQPFSVRDDEVDKCIMAVPMLDDHGIHGVLLIANSSDSHAYSLTDVRMLQVISNLSSVAITNADLAEKLREENREMERLISQVALTKNYAFIAELQIRFVHSCKTNMNFLFKMEGQMQPFIDHYLKLLERKSIQVPQVQDAYTQFNKYWTEWGAKLKDTAKIVSDLNSIKDKPYKPQKSNIVKTIHDAITWGRPQAELWSITINDNDVHPAIVWHDRFALSEALKNLISNSIRACKGVRRRKREINVSGEISMDSGRLSYKIIIKDNGSGVPPDIMPEKLFHPFVSKHRSTGIGLYMVRRIVQSDTYHKGKVCCSSIWGDGASFTLIIPTEETETAN
jgi:signal transduction histidine kinase